MKQKKLYNQTEFEVRRQLKTVVAEGYPENTKIFVLRDRTMNTKYPVYRLEVEWDKMQLDIPLFGRRFLGYMIPDKQLYITSEWDIYAPVHKCTIHNRDGSSYVLDESDWQTKEEVLNEQMDILYEQEKEDVENGTMKLSECMFYKRPRMTIEQYEAYCAECKEKWEAENGKIEVHPLTDEELEDLLASFVPVNKDPDFKPDLKLVTNEEQVTLPVD